MPSNASANLKDDSEKGTARDEARSNTKGWMRDDYLFKCEAIAYDLGSGGECASLKNLWAVRRPGERDKKRRCFAAAARRR